LSSVLRSECPCCGNVDKWNAATLRRGIIKTRSCGVCGASYNPYEQLHKTGPTGGQKRSRAQEKAGAKKYGGSVQVGSGATRHAKGDVQRTGKHRIEFKSTTSRSFSVKLEDLDRIEKIAAAADEIPAFEVEFSGEFPPRSFTVVPSWLFAQLLSAFNKEDT